MALNDSPGGLQIMKKKPKKGKAAGKTLTKTEPCESFFNFFSPPKVGWPGDCEGLPGECAGLGMSGTAGWMSEHRVLGGGRCEGRGADCDL